MASTDDLIQALIGIGKVLIPIIALVITGFIMRKMVYSFWVSSQANEWLLVIRNGKLKNSGIGMTQWRLPGDQTVKFPSLIHQVTFKAEQVSAEMQGIAVQGMLIWSVLRTNEGPMNCYKFFGDDLKKSVPVVANGKLEAMAIAIIRDRIANLTLSDILKNRSKLRDGIKENMQDILNGWGIWLETCEIMDVQICGKSLFTNLQTEFREQERLKATRLSEYTENIIQEESLVRRMEYSKKSADTNDILRHENLERENKFTITKEENDNMIRLEQMKRDLDYRNKDLQNDHQHKTENLERQTEFQKKSATITEQLKNEEFDRVQGFNQIYETTNHEVRKETLERTLTYNKLQAETQNQQQQEQLERNTVYNNKKIELETEFKQFKTNEEFKEVKADADVHKRNIEVEKKRKIAVIDKKENTLQLDLKLEKKQMEFKRERETFKNEIEIAQEANNLALKNEQFLSKKQEALNNLALQKMKHDQQLEFMKRQLEIEDKGYTPAVLKAKLLQNTKEIYQNSRNMEMSIVNLEGGSNNDPAGALLGQMMTGFKAVSQVMDKKTQ